MSESYLNKESNDSIHAGSIQTLMNEMKFASELFTIDKMLTATPMKVHLKKLEHF